MAETWLEQYPEFARYVTEKLKKAVKPGLREYFCYTKVITVGLKDKDLLVFEFINQEYGYDQAVMDIPRNSLLSIEQMWDTYPRIPQLIEEMNELLEKAKSKEEFFYLSNSYSLDKVSLCFLMLCRRYPCLSFLKNERDQMFANHRLSVYFGDCAIFEIIDYNVSYKNDDDLSLYYFKLRYEDYELLSNLNGLDCSNNLEGWTNRWLNLSQSVVLEKTKMVLRNICRWDWKSELHDFHLLQISDKEWSLIDTAELNYWLYSAIRNAMKDLRARKRVDVLDQLLRHSLIVTVSRQDRTRLVLSGGGAVVECDLYNRTGNTMIKKSRTR